MESKVERINDIFMPFFIDGAANFVALERIERICSCLEKYLKGFRPAYTMHKDGLKTDSMELAVKVIDEEMS